MHHGNKKMAEVHSILIGVGFAFIAIYVKLRLFFSIAAIQGCSLLVVNQGIMARITNKSRVNNEGVLTTIKLGPMRRVDVHHDDFPFKCRCFVLLRTARRNMARKRQRPQTWTGSWT